MSEYQFLQLEHRPQHDCATVWLDRPEHHNAFHDGLVAELQRCCDRLASLPVRAVVIAGRGPSFCAGGDLEWMQRAGHLGSERNLEDAERLANALRTLALLPRPTIARVHGAALGGGLGLVAACDIAIAAREAVFGTPEVRLGLVPATVAPYVLAAIGERAARRYFQTGERFDAAEAVRLGLVHEVVDAGALDERIEAVVEALRAGGPQAQAETRQLIGSLRGVAAGAPEAVASTARLLARVRAGAEAREGMSAFQERRRPRWAGPEQS